MIVDISKALSICMIAHAIGGNENVVSAAARLVLDPYDLPRLGAVGLTRTDPREVGIDPADDEHRKDDGADDVEGVHCRPLIRDCCRDFRNSG